MSFDFQDLDQTNFADETVQVRALLATTDLSHDAMFLLSRTQSGRWEIRNCNRATTELFSATQEQLQGKTLEDIFGKGSLYEDDHFLPDICAESGQTLEHESYLAAQGEDYWVVFNWWHFKFSPLPESTGCARHIACLCRCITETRELQGALQKFSSAMSQASSIIAIVELEGTVEYVNPVFESTTGISRDAAIGQGIFHLCMPPDSDKLYAPLIAAMARSEPWQGELPSEKRDGSVYWENVRISPISNDKGIASHYLFIKEDITEKRAIESNLKLASRVLETTDAGVLITNAESQIISINPAFTRITGYSETDVIGKTPRMLSSGTHDKHFYQTMWQHLIADGNWSGELIDRKKNGQTLVESIAISALHDADGQTTHYVGVFSDITPLKDSQNKLENLANFDSLTQLPNRYSLQNRLQHALLRARREHHNLALVYFDLDHFKAVNDTLGHAAGDALLKEVSRRALLQLRDEDTLARLGGDEFVAVLEGIDTPERIAVVAERIIREISLPFVIQGHEVFVGCSLGIAFFPKDGVDADTLMRNADLALYRAKEDGKNCYRLYSEEMNEAAHLRYQIEIRLRRAIDFGELSLVYQPQFDTKTRRLVGAEALLRWTSPDKGSISPAVFIPIAEQIGLIVQIGRWVLEQVCLMQRANLDAGLPLTKIAVNVSPVQFRQKDLVESFQDVLQKTGVPAHCVEVEVTEGAIMVDADKAIETLKQMRAMGLSIAIDDFGTGYSSLGYLKRFPIDKIKIDRTFINELETSPDDAVIISAIIALSNSLGMTTLAEGVETEHQLDFLDSVGCDQIQGYLLGKPLALADFQKVVQQGSAAICAIDDLVGA
jgi:diguanylate cyclase (GGDEF)-like protein/PAS domain S-box-containing protein